MGEWISVDERLPALEVDVMVWIVKGFSKQAVATAGLFFDTGASEPEWMGFESEEPFRRGWRVSHWQPLPPPPQD